MARKRSRARRATVRHHRRRRRSSARKSRRFAAVRAYLPNPRRRRRRSYRRNPFGGGIVSTLKSGVKDGLVVLAAGVATRKAIGFVSGVNPLKGLPGAAVTGLGSAVAVSLIARKFAPNYSRLIAAAAFAEGLKGVLAATPVAPFLSDYITDTQGIGEWSTDEGYGAWPQIPASVQASGMGAWAFGGVNDQEEMQQ